MHRLLVLVPLLACAPLDRARMSEGCRTLYDACLNGCPKPAGGLDPTNPDAQRNASTQGWHRVIAECTDQCNTQAKACK